LLFGREASTSVAIETPSVQSAHQFVAIDFAKDCKVSIAVRASALHDPIANLNLFVRYAASIWVGFAEGFCLGACHSLVRQ
jgi:hypothetical protein